MLDLELRVARRADELARTQQGRSGLNLHCWLVAEAEVFREQISSREKSMPTASAPPLNSAA